MAKVTVTNTARGIRGLYALAGLVNLAPKETREIEISDAELASAKRTGYFEFGGKTAAKADAPAEPQGDGLDGKTVAELDKIIADESVSLPETGTGKNGNIVAADKVAAIRAAREKPASEPQGDGLETMGDDELRATVKTLTGQDAPADASRDDLLALARG